MDFYKRLRDSAAILLLSVLLASCATQPERRPPSAAVQNKIVRLMPSGVTDARGWAADIDTALAAQDIPATTQNICAIVAVTEQESGFKPHPAVPGLAKIARRELERRAAARHIPAFVVDAALALQSPDGRSYRERLKDVRTEAELSALFQDFIGMVPLGKRLFSSFNPVDTGGPMQVSIAFAEAHDQDYPYPVEGSIRNEVFSRRGGMYFGIAHLLGYPTHYHRIIYRFADFNAGWYASRNAALQNAISVASGMPLALDGDLVLYGSDEPGATERAVRSLRDKLDLTNEQIHETLEQGETYEFQASPLYKRIYELAERIAGQPLPRAVLPGIKLESPKITHNLTTAWFAKRVSERFWRCMPPASS
ncbi:DUF1615 domain-containing protein [Dyella sp.]|uniref:DUF1615 domain-containing protein n=1 Tax=Dyella sp. TaxID=1869338 RepID=UPI002D773336|nr:DUF1615 domain-containing protein [Dyella sp.]HET7333109.1 DUF1615 domain-containing protein [Dyella sp.]HET7371027.1 DUF1615 domain-containing protein [Gammaproteobacteria bacterium]